LSVLENIANLEKEIEAACQKANRPREDVLLLAVTKTVEKERIEQALAAGINTFGENKAQELVSKLVWDLPAQWHFIGSLQSNKVRSIIDHVEMIHSLDRPSLAKEIQKRSKEKIIDCLLEINVAQEESKAGLSLDEAEVFLRNLANYPNLRIRGLMTIAPFTQDKEKLHSVFKALRLKQEELKGLNLDYAPLDHLSMGMSNDYQIAIEEGATIIRLGTKVFGPRENI
jgi:pyridoxal phosphate enzyme (YggS family)